MHGHNDRGIFPSKNIMLFFVPEEHKEIFSASLFFSFSAVISQKNESVFLVSLANYDNSTFATIYQLSQFTYDEKIPLANNDYHVPSTGVTSLSSFLQFASHSWNVFLDELLPGTHHILVTASTRPAACQNR